MKIIDLLNKIANGEEPPKKILFREKVYNYEIESKDYFSEYDGYLFDRYVITDILNDEVKILETTYKTDKIEKIDIYKNLSDDFNIDGYRYNICQLADKINEIIDILNKE